MNSLLGFALALTTAIGCVAYQWLVKNSGLAPILVCKMLGCCFFLTFSCPSAARDLGQLCQSRTALLAAGVFLLCEVTTILWFVLTKNTNVAIGALWELVYLPILIGFLIFKGQEALTPNFVIGAFLMGIGAAILSWPK